MIPSKLCSPRPLELARKLKIMVVPSRRKCRRHETIDTSQSPIVSFSAVLVVSIIDTFFSMIGADYEKHLLV